MTGCCAIASDAAIALSGGAGVDELVGGAAIFSSLPVMVDVEGDLEKVLDRGPRWVSFNFLVSFHDILAMHGVDCREMDEMGGLSSETGGVVVGALVEADLMRVGT
jgi:hypothetical protein